MQQAMGMLPFLQAYVLVLALPGTNFLIVAEAGIGGSRRSALAAALGIGLGAGLLALLAVTCSTLLRDQPGILRVTSVCFALLLAKMGVDALRRAASWDLAAERLPVAGAGVGAATAFRRALATAMSNPVTLVFFATAFGALAGNGITGALPVALVFLLASGWWAVVGLAFSMAPVRSAYLRGRAPIDALLGVLLIAMAMRTLFSQYALAG